VLKKEADFKQRSDLRKRRLVCFARPMAGMIADPPVRRCGSFYGEVEAQQAGLRVGTVGASGRSNTKRPIEEQ